MFLSRSNRFWLSLTLMVPLYTTVISTAFADYTWEEVPTGYGLAWSDEFNGAVGSAPNSANWTYDTGTGQPNNELENYTTSTNNSQIINDSNAVDGKALAIISLDPGGNNDVMGNYTSARLKSQNLQTFTYGYMEARIRMPYGQGIWPAFWMLGNNISTVGWPACDEIDIMENIGQSGDQANNHGSLHDGNDTTQIFTLTGGQLFHNEYHMFSALWQSNEIQFFCDGNLYETDTPATMGNNWAFNSNPNFILLNTAVGGNWPGNPDGTTSFPQTMFVDYVRVYQTGFATPTPVVQANWRVRCGGDSYTDSQSNLWVADTNFTGGWPGSTATAISGALPGSGDQALYQNERYGNATGGETLTYTFNVPTGYPYNVTLKFSEDYYTTAGSRMFNYSINGTTEATNFDIFADAGAAYKADDKVYNNISPNGSGQIVIQFTQGSADNPKIDAIQILQVPHTATPTVTSTNTLSKTPTPAFTSTFTNTATSTFSSTNTITPTNTAVATSTYTGTPSLTFTASKTLTPTNTIALTATATLALTSTSTGTPSATFTGTVVTSTFTFTPSATDSMTATSTPSSTLTVGNTFTFTSTQTITPTPSPTSTPTLAFTATPTFTPTSSTVIVNGLCKRVVAYYTGWNSSSYGAAQVPYTKLTHINYAFIIPSGTTGALDTSGFNTTDGASLISNAHANGVKVLISVGGATGSANFSTIAASATSRNNFATQVYNFCVAHNFDGVDIDWEFPESTADRANFDLLLQALRTQMPSPYLISAALSPDSYYDGFLDLATMKNYMDFFNIMAYDYHGSWTNHSGHVAPLYQATGEAPFNHPNANTSYAVSYFTGQGVPPSQINFGLAFYGYSFNTTDIYQACGGNCATNTYTYSQIYAMMSGWSYFWDNSAQSPYLLNGTSTISFDDPRSISTKANYALNNANLGGVFMWALSDDYIGPGNQPLLNQMVQEASLCGSATPTPYPSTTPFPTDTPTITPTPWIATSYRINAAGPNYTDKAGNLWVADSQYTGGTAAAPIANTISGTTDETLYQTERYGNPFSYVLKAPVGQYQVTLKFSENYWTAAGSRVFNVLINGMTVLTNFDIFADAGGEFIADDKVFNNITSNGAITIQFGPASKDNAKVDAIQVIQQPPTSTATPTKTNTPTYTLTPTITLSPTPTWTFAPGTYTPTATSTATNTPPSFTPTLTTTWTGTATATGTPTTLISISKPVVAPNPVSGNSQTVTLWVNNPTIGNLHVKLYTISFREISDQVFSHVAAGVTGLTIDLHDKRGNQLADGLYYIVVDGNIARGMTKLLILR